MNGYVSEGSGENIFIVHKDRIYTPPLGNSVLPGITRNSVIHIAQELGIPVIEQIIPREMLYICDELFSAEQPRRSRRSVRSTRLPSATALPARSRRAFAKSSTAS